MSKDAYYVVRGAKMGCSKGSHKRKINLPFSHGSYLGTQPLMTASDDKAENIPYFGICSGKCSGESIILVAEEGGTISGVKCIPRLGTWHSVQENAQAAEPFLITDSLICCCNGGCIRFYSSGQDE